MLRITQLSGFGSGGDSTPPSITSSSSTSVDGGSTLLFTITTDELATVAIGGADAAQFELVSNAPSLSRTLRWVGNGTQTHAAPNDANADNVYDITITPTDVAGNVGTSQNFLVTVGYDWTDSFTSPQNAGSSNGWAGFTQRQLVGAAALSVSGTYVRLVLEAAAVVTGYGGFTIDAIYIGEQAASGDLYDMKASTPAPTQVLFSGSASVTCAAGQTVTSDPLAFAIDETESYIVSIHFSATGTSAVLGGFGVTGVTAYSKSAVNEAATADVSGYSGTSGTTRGLKKVQVTTP